MTQDKNLTFVIVPNAIEPDVNKLYVVPFEEGKHVLDYLDSLIKLTGSENLNLSINGIIIETQEEYDSLVLKAGDIVSVTCVLDAPIIAIVAAAGLGSALGGAAAFLGTSGILSGILYGLFEFAVSYAVGALATAIGIGVTSSEASDNSATSSPTYSWNGEHQLYTEGNPIPIIFGTNKVSGQVIDQFINYNSSEYLSMLLAVAGHEVDSITDIQINDQPYSNYKNVEVFQALGTIDQAPISEFNTLSDQSNPNIKLTYNTPNVHQTSGNAVDRIDIILTCPNGLYYSNDKGGLDSRSVTVKVAIRSEGTAFNDVATRTITGASTDAIRNQISITGLAPAKYEVQITKISGDSSNWREKTDVYFSSITESVSQPMSYPSVALYGIKALATDQLSGSTPKLTCIVSRNTVQVFNPYTDEWGLKDATNPAWACYALLNTHHGISEDKLVYDEFLSWAETCDELVADSTSQTGLRKRYVINVVLDSAANIWSNVQRIAQIGRAVIIRRGTYYGVFVDRQESIVSHIFNDANIIEGSYSLKYTETKDRANAVEITYNDPEKGYTNQVVTVYSDSYENSENLSNKKSIQFLASIPRQQVINAAAYMLNTNKNLLKAYSWKAFSDSFNCTVGDLAYIQHNVPDYGSKIGGRIVSANTNTVTLDQTIDTSAGNYSILIRLSDDTIVEKAITTLANGNTFTVSSPFTSIPEKDDLFTLGESNIVKEKVRIIQVNRNQDGISTISALEYNDAVYSDSGVYVDVASTSSARKNAVNLSVRENLVYASDGSYQSTINCAWISNSLNKVGSWSIYLQDGEGEIKKVGETSYTFYVIPASYLVLGKTYRVYVIAANSGVVDTGSNTELIVIQGKLNPPSDVAGFSGEWIPASGAINLSWTDVEDIDLDTYEIRLGSSWASGTRIPYSGKTPLFTYSVPTDESTGDKTFWIKAVDSSNIESVTAASVIVNITEVPIITKSTIVSLYKWSTSKPNKPTGKSIYNWETSTNDDYDGTDDWYAVPETNPGISGIHLWQASVIFKAASTTASTEIDWSIESVSLTISASNQESGLQTASISVYQWAVTIPNAPSGTSLYSWNTGTIDDTIPEGWSLATVVSPSNGFTLWAATVKVIDNSGTLETSINWSESIVSSVGFAGTKGSSARVMYARISGNPTPTTGTVTTSGSTSFPTGSNWGITATWSASDATPSSSDSLYQADGIYDPSTGNTVWSTPYISSLKVGSLSAITANLGTVSAGILQSSNYSNTAGMMINLSTDEILMGGSSNPIFKLDEDGLYIKNNSGNSSLELNSTGLTVGNTNNGDYCAINNGDINFYRYINGAERLTNSLKRIETGEVANAVESTIPGYWKNPPNVMVSPAGIASYSASYPGQTQTLQVSATNITQIGTTGQYKFTPIARLVIAAGNASINTNLSSTPSLTKTYYNLDQRPTYRWSGSGTTGNAVVGSNIDNVTLYGTLNCTCSSEIYYITHTSMISYWVGMNANVYFVIDGAYYYVGNVNFLNANSSSPVTINRTFSGSFSLTSGYNHTISMYIALDYCSTFSGSINLGYYDAHLIGNTILAAGTLNYMAIGE